MFSSNLVISAAAGDDQEVPVSPLVGVRSPGRKPARAVGRLVQLRERLAFTLHAPGVCVAVQATAQQLDGHPAVEVGVAGGVDEAHAAAADQVFDDVAIDVGAEVEAVGLLGLFGLALVDERGDVPGLRKASW